MNLFPVYPLYNITPIRGKDCYVYDEQDNAYLDCYGGHAVISVGHTHPHYVARIQEQLHKLVFYSNSVQIPLQQELADKLGKLSGLEDYQLFLCNSGAEAIENALKIASFHTGKQRIIAFEKAFHGRTAAAVNITDSEKIKAPLNRGFAVDFLPLNDIAALEAAFASGEVCAVIVEGIQGIGGIYIPDHEFLQAAQRLCRKYNAVFILDEIQSGYGRTGKFFAFQHTPNILPDLITVAKGMGNGFPIGGVLIHPRFKAVSGMLGTTFGGNHIACAAALAVIEIMEAENLIANAAAVGKVFIEALQQLPDAITVRGRGLMIGVSFNYSVNALRARLLFEENIFTGSASDTNVLRLLPPLTFTTTHAHLVSQKIGKACAPIPSILP